MSDAARSTVVTCTPQGGGLVRTTRWAASVCALVAVVMCLAACEDKQDPFVDGGQHQLPDSVRYGEHIQPLLDAHCTGCHASYRQGADRNGAPLVLNLDSYADAVTWSEYANEQIQAGTMPPSGELSDYQRALFQRWVEQGTPE